MYYQESLDTKAGKIYHSKTKEYFIEVLSSFNNNNFRSATVMLYSVVICDLVYKLQELSDRYDDTIAKDILQKVNEAKEENSKFSHWENKLLAEVKRTNLLEAQDETNIKFLKEHRHLSAHPVLNQLDLLFQPNREMVLAHILNMLEGVLCKSPLLSKDLISPLLEDIVNVKDVLNHNDEFKRFINSKYLSKINKAAEEKLFRDLWKFAFRLVDSKTSENREKIINTLLIIYKKNKSSYNELVKLDKSYYSDINLQDDFILRNVMMILSINPQLYNSLDDSIKVILESKGKSGTDLFSIAVFLSSSIEDHFEELKNKVLDEEPELLSTDSIELLYLLSKEHGCVENYLNLMVEMFNNSHTYDSADYYFSRIIMQHSDLFNVNQFKSILDAINNNNQINRRKRASIDNSTLKEIIDKRFEGEIDYSIYSNF